MSKVCKSIRLASPLVILLLSVSMAVCDPAPLEVTGANVAEIRKSLDKAFNGPLESFRNSVESETSEFVTSFSNDDLDALIYIQSSRIIFGFRFKGVSVTRYGIEIASRATEMVDAKDFIVELPGHRPTLDSELLSYQQEFRYWRNKHIDSEIKGGRVLWGISNGLEVTPGDPVYIKFWHQDDSGRVHRIDIEFPWNAEDE